ncbi:uncharacterized protein LOC112522285 [Cynara cardunculus var. scolymus]|uniref:Mal d 1-associated protein n=1 Tax=Cynara cardunculus var. scolymus TaxID=59895 RepID=A0A118JT87_CYNCS|nr:uncharacterized protein LOC112522285 [Cynara cardunculus var. scolymus]KVH90562.1 hypothetical protein Ccrd_007421 [Cynara cardunculus var. scolymus]
MGWVWKDDDEDRNADETNEFEVLNPGSEARCSTRKIISSQCRTEEVEPGKFIKKCEKTEQLLKDCVGRPSEVVQSNKEYTEEDVTEQVKKGMPSSEVVPFDFPGLRSDIEAIERNLFGNMNRFFEAAEDMKNGFFGIFGSPHLYDGDADSKSAFGSHVYDGDSKFSSKRSVPIEPFGSKSVKAENRDGHVDISGLARDV